MSVNDRGHTSKEELSFEEAFGRLETAVKALEQGGLTLKEATNLFEEGMSLVSLCNKHLNATALKVTRIKKSFSKYIDTEQDLGDE